MLVVRTLGKVCKDGGSDGSDIQSSPAAAGNANDCRLITGVRSSALGVLWRKGLHAVFTSSNKPSTAAPSVRRAICEPAAVACFTQEL